jgi:hypothetical protein
MKLLARFITTIIFVTHSSFLISQNVISLKNGETLDFEKLIIDNDQTSVQIIFKENSKQYNANEIEYIQRSDDEKYVAKKIIINHIEKNYLLRHIEEGRVNLFAFKDHMFFIESDGKPMESLFFTRKDPKALSIDTLYRFAEIEGKFYQRNHFQTVIQNHVGPSLTVSNNLKLKETSIKKVIQSSNFKFPAFPRKSFFNPLVAKRLYIGAIGFNTDGKFILGSQISYEIGINYKGMLSTGYLSFLLLTGINDINQDEIGNITQRLSFGIKQHFLKNSPIKPFLDFGIQNGLPVFNTGILYQHNNFLINGSVNLINGIFIDKPSNLKGIYQLNLGFQF